MTETPAAPPAPRRAAAPKAWRRPALTRLAATAAQLEIGPTDDGSDSS